MAELMNVPLEYIMQAKLARSWNGGIRWFGAGGRAVNREREQWQNVNSADSVCRSAARVSIRPAGMQAVNTNLHSQDLR